MSGNEHGQGSTDIHRPFTKAELIEQLAEIDSVGYISSLFYPFLYIPLAYMLINSVAGYSTSTKPHGHGNPVTCSTHNWPEVAEQPGFRLPCRHYHYCHECRYYNCKPRCRGASRYVQELYECLHGDPALGGRASEAPDLGPRGSWHHKS